MHLRKRQKERLNGVFLMSLVVASLSIVSGVALSFYDGAGDSGTVLGALAVMLAVAMLTALLVDVRLRKIDDIERLIKGMLDIFSEESFEHGPVLFGKETDPLWVSVSRNYQGSYDLLVYTKPHRCVLTVTDSSVESPIFERMEPEARQRLGFALLRFLQGDQLPLSMLRKELAALSAR